jgi:phosphate-selective porin OprO/OprP
VPSYKSPGQNGFFSYLSTTDNTKLANNVIADGTRYRLTPQLYWYVWHFGLMAEYVYSAQTLLKVDTHKTIANQAWQVLLTVVLTPGDKATFDGLQPKRPFTFRRGSGPGGVELVARYHELRIDDAAFNTFADDTKSAKDARALGIGANWYLNSNLRFALNYERTVFTKGNGDGGNRFSEDALFGRLQIAF